MAFWQLQIMGWGGFYLLVLAASLPYLKEPGVFLDSTVFVVSMFIVSYLLRPICRRLFKRSQSWLGLEGRAFGLSMVVGTGLAFLTDLTISGFQKVEVAQAVVDSLQYSVVLLLWCSLYFSIKQWQQSIAERERLLRAEAEAREARLGALRYQLNPHFLFNALNAVSTLVLEGKAREATQMLAQIGDLLRTTLDGETPAEIALSQEVAFTERYLAVEQTRLGDRLRVDWRIAPETLDALVPGMLLQPLVENAVRHGIAPLVDGGIVTIESRLVHTKLQLVVTNPGNGPGSSDGKDKTSSGIGLSNTAARLKGYYGDDQKVTLGWPETGTCEVTVELPFRKRQAGAACAY